MSEKQQVQQDILTKEAVQHDFLTIQQVMARLQLNRDLVYKMVRAGDIPSIRVPGSNAIRIPRPEYERWLDNLGRAV
jgi:excisionase family DNA binding protein